MAKTPTREYSFSCSFQIFGFGHCPASCLLCPRYSYYPRKAPANIHCRHVLIMGALQTLVAILFEVKGEPPVVGSARKVTIVFVHFRFVIEIGIFSALNQRIESV